MHLITNHKNEKICFALTTYDFFKNKLRALPVHIGRTKQQEFFLHFLSEFA